MFSQLFNDGSLADYISEQTIDPWQNTPFCDYVFMSPKQKGEFGERFVSKFMGDVMSCDVQRAKTSTAGHDRVIDKWLVEIKFALATRDAKKGGTKKDSFIINHVSRDKDWQRLIFFGINEDEKDARLYYFNKADFLYHLQSDKCLFAHQQGGKKIENDDYICTKVNKLIQEDWVHPITEW